ncbi:MAG: right-handed parallel beta-helix repeat-containing protein [Planctomycetota bacterium]|jgi:hypothetical protein
MWKVVITILFTLCIINNTNANYTQTSKADFYIATNGNDNNPGTKTQPFATLTRSRDAVRELLKEKPDRDITVFIRGGTYRIKETIVFGLQDSAPDGHKVIYTAYPGEKPVLDAGQPITNWNSVTESLPGLPLKAKGKIYSAPVPKGLKYLTTLFNSKQRLPRARSEGFKPIQKYTRQDWHKYRTKLHFPKGTIRQWPNLKDADLLIIPGLPWVMNILPFSSVDQIEQIANFEVPSTYCLGQVAFGHLKNADNAWVENILDALDEPGEWVLNTSTNHIYIWPKDNKPPQNIVAPALTEFIRIEGHIDYNGPADKPVTGLVFSGLTFTHGDLYRWKKEKIGWGLQHDWEMFDKPTAMVRLRSAENCIIQNCHFIDSGSAAIRLDLHCQNNNLINNHIEHIGCVGILLAGYGPGTKDVNKNNNVLNNHIHHVGQLLWHSPAIFAWQSGHNRIANNLIHHTPYTAIVVSGRIVLDREGKGECSQTVRWKEIDAVCPKNSIGKISGLLESWQEREQFLHGRDNLVENNEIHHVMQILGDGNAIYISGTGGNNIIRYNYIHDITSISMNAAIRCDDDQHDTIIHGNIIWRCCGEGFIIKGRNTVTNNIFADLRTKTPDNKTCYHWRGHIVLPCGNVNDSIIRHNIFYATEKEILVLTENKKAKYGTPLLHTCRADNNIYYNTADKNWGLNHLIEQRKYGIEQNSIALDPMFADAANGNFRLLPDSPALKLGFKEIHLGNVGIINYSNTKTQ